MVLDPSHTILVGPYYTTFARSDANETVHERMHDPSAYEPSAYEGCPALESTMR